VSAGGQKGAGRNTPQSPQTENVQQKQQKSEDQKNKTGFQPVQFLQLGPLGAKKSELIGS